MRPRAPLSMAHSAGAASGIRRRNSYGTMPQRISELMPISSENINVSLQVDTSATPEPVSKRKNPRLGPTRLAPHKPNPPATSTAGDELKDEPNFGSAADPSRGPG